MGSAPDRAEPTTDGSRLKLAIWHPDCWTLQVTADNPGGLLGHGVHEVDGKAIGRFTAYADSEDQLQTLIDAIHDSELTHDIWEDNQHVASESSLLRETNASRGLLVRYDHQDSINDALISRGFIPDASVRIEDQTEYWTVVIYEDRETIHDRLEEVRHARSATVDVELLTSLEKGMGGGLFRDDELSTRQREVLELAQEMNYYSWPREVTAGDLAAELDISDSTALEHLRKAEAKLLDTNELGPDGQ
jgi:predicted DNA binding protein